jgi:hypothetical protein
MHPVFHTFRITVAKKSELQRGRRLGKRESRGKKRRGKGFSARCSIDITDVIG